MMPIAPRNKIVQISSNGFFQCIYENHSDIEESTVDTTKITVNNFDEEQILLLSPDNNDHDKAFEKRDEEGMIRKIMMISSHSEHFERECNQMRKEKRLKSSFESPTPYDSTTSKNLVF